MPYRATFEGWVATRAMQFIEQAAEQERPFFVHASLPKPHQVYCPAQRFWDLYETAELTLPANADYSMVHQAPHLVRAAERYRTAEWTVFEPRTFEAGRLRKLHGYLGCVSQVDHAVGELLDFLEEQGLAEDTIVVYGSDHGDYACEHGIMEKAPGICHDAITRVPLLWHWPGHLAGGHVAHEIVESVDVSATLCSLARMGPMATGDGRDLSHLLKGNKGEVHEIGVTEFAWSRSVRKGRYRYVHYAREMFPDEYPDGFGELYDLERDPWEMHNLYFDPSYAPIVLELKSDLLDWLIGTTRVKTALGARVAGAQTVSRFKNAVQPDSKFAPQRFRPNQNYL
jgi:choline-sulfatase/uncharacterized sulfatase